MVPVLTVSQMREIDEKAIAGDLTIGYSYMLKAGMGLFNAAREMLPDPRLGDIAVICGKGNNGGDGYVVGRLLLDSGYRVMCFSICDVEMLKGEARLAFSEYAARKGNFLILNDADELAALPQYKLIIDAMLGTGLQGDPRGLCAAVIEAVNNAHVPVLAVDTPSGLNNDTGQPGNPCIAASTTVAMGFPKVGMYFHPGREFVGKLVIRDLSYPDEIVAEKKSGLYCPSRDTFKKMLPPRHPAGSKIDHGLALLVCGSRGMTGSAELVAKAALRTGCGMTHLAVPESSLPILAAKLTETVLHPIHETSSGTPAPAAAERIRELAARNDALCVGPGISHDPQTCRLVRELVRSVSLPLVLDADGLNAFKDTVDDLRSHCGEVVMTPHRGEWARLFGDLPPDPVGTIERVRRVAYDFRATVLLKGSPTIVADATGKSYLLPFGTSALATAGTGDVLSGIVVSLLAQGAAPCDAAVLGAFIQGEAGVLASRRLGEYSVIASDVIGAIYRVIRSLTEYHILELPPATGHDSGQGDEFYRS